MDGLDLFCYHYTLAARISGAHQPGRLPDTKLDTTSGTKATVYIRRLPRHVRALSLYPAIAAVSSASDSMRMCARSMRGLSVAR